MLRLKDSYVSQFASVRHVAAIDPKAIRLLFTIAVFVTLGYALPAAANAQTGIKGKIRDSKGIGIAGASVEARQDGKVVRSTKSDPKGNFSLNLESGTYNIAFDASGYSTGILYKVEVRTNKMRDLGSNLIMTRDKGTLILVKGAVFDKNNLSIYGAVVDLYLVKADGDEKKVATSITNEFGDFGFRGQDATGRYRVKASFKGVKAVKDIDADQPQVYRTAIHLDLDRSKDN